MSVTISAVQQQGIFDVLKQLRAFADYLATLGIDFGKLGELGAAFMAAIKIVKDTAASAAQKVDAVLDLVDKFVTATKLTWDDELAKALRSLEPLLVKLVGNITGKSYTAEAMIASDAAALGIGLTGLWSLAMAVWEIVQLFLASK